MNVLHIISGNDNGGGGNHVINICSNDIDDMKCSILCIGSGPLYDKALKNNISAFNFTFKQIINGKLEDIIYKNDIDMLNFHGAKSNFLYFIMNKKLNLPCIATVHSDYRYDFLNNSFKRYFYTPLSIIGLKKFNSYICVSDYLKKLLEDNNFKGNKYVVNNGVKFDSFKESISPDILRQEFHIRSEDFVYVMIARMHPIKNHKKLIKAFSYLKKEFENVKLLLVGDGPLEEHLKKLSCDLKIRDSVKFAGFRDNPLDFINASDISVLTSFSEGGAPPLVILESAILKKSIICSNVCDMDKSINKGSGYLVNPDNERDIFTNMKTAYLNRKNLCYMGENLYNDMVIKFSLAKFWQNYYNAYKQILSGV